jgi:hypothetical protein
MLIILRRCIILVSLLCALPQICRAQSAGSDGLTTLGGATLAYSASANGIAAGGRSYTLQPSVNGRLGIMQMDLGARYKSRWLQATLVGQQGWFADANYIGDDYAYRYLQQAWAGIDVSAHVSLRAGVMPSHIGYESINERENLLVSRLFCSDATPYYETGATLQWRPTDQLTLEGLVLNGWQRIVAINDDVAWGSRIVWRPDSALTLNWSTFYGNMFDRRSLRQPSSAQLGWRFYSNLWAEWKPSADLTVVAIVDNGHQMISAESAASTFSVAAILAYNLRPSWRIAARAEHYSDPASVIVQAAKGRGFVASSVSANVDWSATTNVRIRAELRGMFSTSKIFLTADGVSSSELFSTVTVSTQL